MSVAVEFPAEVQRGLRAVPVPATNADVESWEVHSELTLVCPEVSRRARELLPVRDPDAFLTSARKPILLPTPAAEESAPTNSLSAAIFGHALWRLGEVARFALAAVTVLVALALLAELVH